MKNKKSVSFRICCIIGLTVLLIFGLGACWNRMTFEEAFKSNWEIDLPKNMVKEYNKSDSAGLAGQGDGTRYTVFKLEAEPTNFLTDFSSKKDKNFESNVNKATSQFGIPENFLPDWDAEYSWKHVGKNYWEEYGFYGDNLYMIYIPNSLRLICCECL